MNAVKLTRERADIKMIEAMEEHVGSTSVLKLFISPYYIASFGTSL